MLCQQFYSGWPQGIELLYSCTSQRLFRSKNIKYILAHSWFLHPARNHQLNHQKDAPLQSSSSLTPVDRNNFRQHRNWVAMQRSGEEPDCELVPNVHPERNPRSAPIPNWAMLCGSERAGEGTQGYADEVHRRSTKRWRPAEIRSN